MRVPATIDVAKSHRSTALIRSGIGCSRHAGIGVLDQAAESFPATNGEAAVHCLRVAEGALLPHEGKCPWREAIRQGSVDVGQTRAVAGDGSRHRNITGYALVSQKGIGSSQPGKGSGCESAKEVDVQIGYQRR